MMSMMSAEVKLGADAAKSEPIMAQAVTSPEKLPSFDESVVLGSFAVPSSDSVLFVHDAIRHELPPATECSLSWTHNCVAEGSFEFARRGRLGTADAMTARLCLAQDRSPSSEGTVGAYTFRDMRHTFVFSASQLWGNFLKEHEESLACTQHPAITNLATCAPASWFEG